MNEKMALNLISQLMNWDDGRATQEFDWLRLMANVKYDGYADFRSGVRFLESLVTWLKQFETQDRITAYDFVKNRLVYISPAEMLQLVESFFPELVERDLRRSVAEKIGVEEFEVWAKPEGLAAYQIAKRKTLFLGISDGSRIDILRRANAKTLSTEQIVPMMNIDEAKWEDLAANLSADLRRLENEYETDAGERKFDRLYLIDDFTASGTTFVRKQIAPDGTVTWKGKLRKFNELVNKGKAWPNFPLSDSFRLCIHHYISSAQAHSNLSALIAEARTSLPSPSFGDIEFGESLLLPENLRMDDSSDARMMVICDKYYDHALFTRLEKHCKEAGMQHIRRGYADCALPIVLDHNTPNNSLSILWATTEGQGAHAMEPLFQRRDRHG